MELEAFWGLGPELVPCEEGRFSAASTSMVRLLRLVDVLITKKGAGSFVSRIWYSFNVKSRTSQIGSERGWTFTKDMDIAEEGKFGIRSGS